MHYQVYRRQGKVDDTLGVGPIHSSEGAQHFVKVLDGAKGLAAKAWEGRDTFSALRGGQRKIIPTVAGILPNWAQFHRVLKYNPLPMQRYIT